MSQICDFYCGVCIHWAVNDVAKVNVSLVYNKATETLNIRFLLCSEYKHKFDAANIWYEHRLIDDMVGILQHLFCLHVQSNIH